MNHDFVKNLLVGAGRNVSLKIHRSIEDSGIENLSSVHSERDDDTIYQIDKDVEDVIVPILESLASDVGGIRLIAEGISEKGRVFPDGTDPKDAEVIVIMDPIDGTRGIMYDKRSAFFLAGAAINTGDPARLQDIELAVMVELPTSRSHVSDTLWAVKGEGTHAETWDMRTGAVSPRNIQPSKAPTILGGFGQIARFFPPGRQLLAAIEEEMIETLFPDPPEGKAILFEDQYISSGGQLYELLMGHDRFVADVRTALYRKLAGEGGWTGHCCHPYDLAAHLIGAEAGLIITGIDGNPLDAPLDTTSPVDWIGYANSEIRSQVEPVLKKLFVKYGLISSSQ